MKKFLFTIAAIGVFACASLFTINLTSEDAKTATTPDTMDFEEWTLLATTPDTMDFEEWTL